MKASQRQQKVLLTELYFVFGYLILFWITNFILLTFAEYLTATKVKFFIFTRDIIVLFLLLINIPRKIRIRLQNLIWLGLGILWSGIIFNLLSKPEITNSALVYIRNLTFPWFFLFVGVFYGQRLQIKDFEKILKWFRAALIIFSIISLVLYFGRSHLISCYLLERFAKISMKSYYDPKFCLLKNAISYDFFKYIKTGLPRLFGLVLDPPISGVILSFGAIYLFLKRRAPWLETIVLVALLLTLSKGAIFIYILFTTLAFLMLVGINCCRNQTVQAFKYIFLLLLFGILILPFVLNVDFAASITNHLQGFTNGIKVMLTHPFGVGLGSYGNFAPQWTPVRESLFGAIAAQLGFWGFLGFMGILFGVYKLIIEALRSNRYLIALVYLFFFVFLLSALFSESTISVSGSSFIFYIFGLAYGTMYKEG